MPNLILLTGATGALGSEILTRLVLNRRNKVLCIVRRKGIEDPQKRIERIIGDVRNNEIIHGDICQPLCGVSSDFCRRYRNRVSSIVHCAASISFWDRKESEATNIEGVKNILALAEALNINIFHHVSTAYVSGGAASFTEETIPVAGVHCPRNVYEETKQLGESLVRAWVNASQCRRVSIYRPSILIGRESGTSPTFDAYYGYFKPIHSIVEAMRRKLQNGDALPPDVIVNKNGEVDIPLVLTAFPEATLNVVPINWVAEMITELLFTPLRGNKIFHLVNPNPPRVRWVIDVSLRHLKVRTGVKAKIKIVGDGAEKAIALEAQSPLVSRLQRQLARVLDQYYPYTTQEPKFYARNAEEILGTRFRIFRKIDADFLGLLLTFALEENWGVSMDTQ